MLIQPVVLQGRAVRLEPLTRDHHAALSRIGLEPVLWERTTICVRTADDMAGYIQDALDAQHVGTALPFVIIDLASGTIVGTTRYHSIVPAHRRVNIGFTWIAVPWQRRGVNVEAKYLMLRHAFEQWKCERVEFKADSRNHVSRRAILALGATEEGLLRSYVVSADRGVRDLVVFSIVLREWPRAKAHLERRLEGRAG